MPVAPGFWDRRAAGFAASWRDREEPLLSFLAPWLAPDRTLIDAGAGYGRHAVPLAARLDWVTAVEPSEAMRAQIPAFDNLTVVASTWEEAEVAPADLVICSHVLYGVPEVAPFVQKLAACARERVFIYLRDRQQVSAADELYRVFAGRPRSRQPVFQDLYNLLRQLGVDPDVHLIRYPTSASYATLEEAAADCRDRVGSVWEEERGLAWLRERLDQRPDGSLVYEGGQMVAGVAHWRP